MSGSVKSEASQKKMPSLSCLPNTQDKDCIYFIRKGKKFGKKYVQDVRQYVANFTSVIFKIFPQQFCEVHDSISISEVGKPRLVVRATTALCK